MLAQADVGVIAPLNYLDWDLEHHTVKGFPISYAEHAFMVGMIEVWDDRREIVVQAPNQVAKSEYAVGGALYEADAHGRSVIYYFPTDNSITKHVQERVDPIVQGHPGLRARVLEHDAGQGRKVARVHVKKVGRGWLHFRGANSPMARQATPADVLVLDEFSLFDENWLPEIEKRMNASKVKRVRKLSVPRFVGCLIQEAYEASDQRVWMVRCSACGNLQDLDWFRDVVTQKSEHLYELRDTRWTPDDRTDPKVFCARCSKPINRLGAGAWVARRGGREVAGFHLNRLATHSATVRDLWRTFDQAIRTGDQTAIQMFYNGDLGIGYTPKTGGLTVDVLDAARRKYLMPSSIPDTDAVLTAGFDVQGEYLVARVSRVVHRDGERVRQAVFLGRVSWSEMDDLFRRYPIKLAVIDGKYDPTKCKEFQAEHSQVWLAYYPAKDNPKSEMLDANRGERTVTVQRTVSLDRSLAELNVGRSVLPQNADKVSDFYPEMTDPVRVTEEDQRGNKRAAWRKRRRDDFRHADNYDFVAAELLDQGVASGPAVIASRQTARDDALRRLRREGRA